LVFIMLAGEKGIWGTLEPRLQQLFARVTRASRGKREEDTP
jgi:hypothetical protein